MSRRKILLAAVVLGGLTAALISAFGTGGSREAVRGELAHRLPTQLVTGHVGQVLLQHGREGDRGGASDPDAGLDPAALLYADQAYPFSGIGIAQTIAAHKAAKRLKGHDPKHASGWQEVGPFTLDVQPLGTQTGGLATQWSGRVTALAVDPSCGKGVRCTLYVAAAGGGIWRTNDALAKHAHWTPISGDIPSTAIGSLLIDPTDSSGRTIYAGTGEESGSSDSEAGVGLYKSTDGGNHWSLVSGSFAVSNNRSIGAVSVDPANAQHIFIGTDVARHGASSVNGGRMTPPNAPKLAVYESTDGGASFHEVLSRPSDSVDPTSPNGSDFFRGGVTDIQYDPTHAGTLYATITDSGLFRSSDNGTTWTQIFTGQADPEGFGIRYEMAPTTLGNGNTRIYLAEGLNEFTDPVTDESNPDSASRLLRTDDATGGSPSFTNLTSSDPSNPGFGSFDFCEAQCSYDMFVATPTGQPDTVWLGGSMHYDELPPYAGADRSDGRGVVRSTDGGASWTDMTGDNRSPFEDQHPDMHAIAFDPRNANIALIGSDGGMIRTDGKWGDASSQCGSRGLDGTDLADCQAWLSTVPHRLITMNAGLRTLQFEDIAVDPRNPLNDLLGGTQDNATPAYEGDPNGEWVNTMSGDGGNSGIDVKNSNLRYHTYFSDQGDVNFHGNNQTTWDWYMDPLIFSGEGASFYVPFVADPRVSKTAYVGANHVWRTQDGGGDPHFLDNHCFTDGGPKGDQLFTGNCGDWVAMGNSLRSSVYGATRRGSAGSNYVSQIGRTPSDSNTLWASTRLGRVFVTKNANATGQITDFQDPFGLGVTLHDESDVVWTRIDDGESSSPVTPERFPSGISIDAKDSNHAIVSYSGYNAYATAAGTPTGHVFDVHFNPTTGTATWTNISYDLGDQPITGVQLDSKTGDIYAGTDFGVWVLAHGTTSWAPASSGLPMVAVYGLQLAKLGHGGRVLYAATHGRGIFRLVLH